MPPSPWPPALQGHPRDTQLLRMSFLEWLWEDDTLLLLMKHEGRVGVWIKLLVLTPVKQHIHPHTQMCPKIAGSNLFSSSCTLPKSSCTWLRGFRPGQNHTLAAASAQRMLQHQWGAWGKQLCCQSVQKKGFTRQRQPHAGRALHGPAFLPAVELARSTAFSADPFPCQVQAIKFISGR